MAKPKQEELPAIEGEGVAQKRIKKIEALADAYVETRDTRMTWTKKECEARDTLIQAMTDNGLTRYSYGDQEIVIKGGKAKVKVKTVDSMESDEEESED